MPFQAIIPLLSAWVCLLIWSTQVYNKINVIQLKVFIYPKTTWLPLNILANYQTLFYYYIQFLLVFWLCFFRCFVLHYRADISFGPTWLRSTTQNYPQNNFIKFLIFLSCARARFTVLSCIVNYVRCSCCWSLLFFGVWPLLRWHRISHFTFTFCVPS